MTDSDTDSDSISGFGFPNTQTRKWILGVLVVSLTVSAGVAVVDPLGTNSVDVDDSVQVELVSGGEVVSTVTAETATTTEEMKTGLSDHESLSAGEGMLFYHQTEGEQTYVMPDMAFGLDMVFVGADCTVQSIQVADPPAEGDTGYEPQYQYTADANYVLEVPQGYASERISVGDTVRFAGGCN